MSTQAPIACTLTEAELPARRAQTAAIARDLVSANAYAARGVLRFRPGARTRERVAAFVEAERRCCAFLRIELLDEPDALTLTVEGPAGSDAVVQEWVAAITAEAA